MDNIIKKSSDKYVASKFQLFLHKNGCYNLPVHFGRNKNNSDCQVSSSCSKFIM